MNLLAAIALTTPLMLIGMSAVALPIVAHLLNRRARQRIVFPTIRLLQEAAASQSRLFRLRRLILLALRCLAIILIAWAFARPVWTQRDALGGEEAGTAVVLVIDVSASAGQQEMGVPLMHELTAAAHATLDQLRPGRDLIDLVYATAQPRAAFGKLTANVDATRADLRQAQPTPERADLPGALELARSIVQRHEGPRRIVLLSDMQATNWADLGEIGGDVTVVPVGEGAAANVALSRPRFFPARPVANHPATAAVTVTNFSPRSQRVHLEAVAGDAPLGARDLTLDSGQQREVTFDTIFDKPGDHAVRFTIGPDDLAVDNHAHAVAEVVDRITVAVLSDDDSRSPAGGAFYLMRALSPGDEESAGPMRVRHLRSTEVSEASLQDVDAVVLADAAPLGTGEAQALIDYVRGGGGLIVLGNAGALGAVQTQPRLLPFTPIPLAEPVMRHISGGAWSAAALRHFDLPAQDALARIPILTDVQAGQLTADALVLLRFADGSPALAEQSFGAGRVALAAFDVSPPSELPKHGLFVALLHGLVEQVLRRPAAATDAGAAVVGRPAQIVVDVEAGVPLTVRDPRGQPLLAQRSDEGGKALLHLPPLKLTGVYRVNSPAGEVALLAANVDERESDLRPLVTEHLQRITGTPSASANAAAAAALPLEANSKPLWHVFMIAALAAIALELVLLTIWKRT